MISIFGSKTIKSFVSSIGSSKSHCFKDSFSHSLVKVWKNSYSLKWHMKNAHKESKNVCQKEISSTKIIFKKNYLLLP